MERSYILIYIHIYISKGSTTAVVLKDIHHGGTSRSSGEENMGYVHLQHRHQPPSPNLHPSENYTHLPPSQRLLIGVSGIPGSGTFSSPSLPLSIPPSLSLSLLTSHPPRKNHPRRHRLQPPQRPPRPTLPRNGQQQPPLCLPPNGRIPPLPPPVGRPARPCFRTCPSRRGVHLRRGGVLETGDGAEEAGVS